MVALPFNFVRPVGTLRLLRYGHRRGVPEGTVGRIQPSIVDGEDPVRRQRQTKRGLRYRPPGKSPLPVASYCVEFLGIHPLIHLRILDGNYHICTTGGCINYT